jgi:peptidoglycan/LPS O-acetylase OafA/YrhL
LSGQGDIRNGGGVLSGTGRDIYRPTYLGLQVFWVLAAVLVLITHSILYASERLDPPLSIEGLVQPVEIFFIISGSSWFILR